jgi:uncharacterized protein (PEP-CTERM system associated)
MATTKRRRRIAAPRGAAAAGAALLAVAAASQAQQVPSATPGQAEPRTQQQAQPLVPAQPASPVSPPIVQPTLELRAIATDNSGLTTSANKKSDLIADVNAGLLVRRRSARLNIDGDIGLEFIGYADHSQPDRVLPRGKLNLNATLVERNLFFDGGVEARRTRADPLAAQGEGASTANVLSTLTYRASPYFSHEFSSDVTALARSDTIISHNFGGDPVTSTLQRDSRLQRELLRVERRPLPWGVALDASREDTRYAEQSDTVLRVDSVRAIGSVAIGGDWVAGLIVGHDHSVYSLNDVSDSRRGVMARWRPTERTLLDAEVEHRFFGTGWNLRFRHRWPLTILDVTMQRAPSATPVSAGVVESASDVAKLFGPRLSAQFPNAADPTAAARDLLASRGIPADLSKPLLIFSESAQLSQRATVSVTTTGVRTTLSGTAFYVKAEALDRGATVPTLQSFDSRQWGGSMSLNRRLAPDTTGTVELSWSDLQGLGARIGESARQATGSVAINRRLSTVTSFTAGLQHLASRVVVAAGGSTTRVDETQVFAGIRMRY